MMVLTAIYVPGLVVFEKALRDARRFEKSDSGALIGARERLVHARQAWEASSYRTAIVDASAAADLAQTVFGPFSDRSTSAALDELRRAAIDPSTEIGAVHAQRAIEAARTLLDGTHGAIATAG